MKVLTRKATGIRSVLTLLMILVGAVALRAQDTLPSMTAFGADVRGVLLLNGWNGDYAEQNAALVELLEAQGVGTVVALDAAVDRPEDLSVIQQTYNASVVLWWSGKEVHFAVFIPAVFEDFAPYIDPTTFAISGLDNNDAAGIVRSLWFYAWQNYATAAAGLTGDLTAIPANSDHSALYLYRGLSYAWSFSVDAAKADFARVPAQVELSAWAHYATGSVLYKNYDYAGAIAEYTLAAGKTSDRALLHTIFASRGIAQHMLGDLDAAVQDYSQAIELDNTSAGVYEQRGIIFYNEGDYERAVPDFSRLLALSPNNMLAWQYRAKAYIELGDYDSAIEDYTAAIKLANENNSLCQCLIAHRAQVYHMAQDYDLAIADYEASLGYGPYMMAYTGLAKVYIDINEPEKALGQLHAAEAMPGISGGNYLSIGSVYEALGDFEAAGVNYRKWVDSIQTERIDETALSGRSGSMELEMVQGRTYYIPVEMRSGKTLTVNAVAEGAGLDPLIVILDSSGQPVSGSDDVDTGDLDAGVSAFKPAKPGLYTIVVTHAGSGSNGTLDLNWSKQR